MLSWRLVKAGRAATAFDGEAARLFGGRWNHPGAAAEHASATIALAVLEYLVHLDPDELPEKLAVIPVEFDAGLVTSVADIAELPEGWRANPAGDAARDIGTALLRSTMTPVLEVPSAVVPEESNYVLNPLHPRFTELRIGDLQPFSLDPRLR